MSVVEVAVGIVLSPQGEVLIAKRAEHLHQGGKWEFPGGKLEAGETVVQALARELHEELGIEITECRPLMQIDHDYGDKRVSLLCRTVTRFTGEPRGLEEQPVRWVALSDLSDYEFPAANRPIIEELLKRYG